MNRKTAILCCLFITGALFSPAAGAVSLFTEKAVKIDSEWEITASYRYTVRIDTKVELKSFSEIILPENNPVRRIETIFGTYGRENGSDTPARIVGHRLVLDELCMGDTVSYGFIVVSRMAGFEGTFSDRFEIRQNGEPVQAHYVVTFPVPTAFQWTIDTGERDQAPGVRKELAGRFEWDSRAADPIPAQAVLRMSTFMSWEEVRDRFISVYGQAVGKQPAPSACPFAAGESQEEKLAATIAYLTSSFRYESYLSETHALLPDSPAVVASRGWGDCKDLTLLGVSLLNAAGVSAFPVLSGTQSGSSSFPDPYSLRHAVMGIRLGKELRYYDWTLPDGRFDLAGKQIVSLEEGWR